MLRAVSNTLFSLLLLASYLWGGCVSCEQFFMLPGAKGSCCDADKCKKPARQSNPVQTQQDCQRMPLDRQPAAHSHFELAAASASTPISIGMDAPLFDPIHTVDPVTGYPPDLPILHASLLI